MATAIHASQGNVPAADTEERYALSVETQERSVLLGRRRLHLTETEYEIMELLWLSRPQVVSREQMIQRLYQGKDQPSARTIDVFISHVRQKLKLASGGLEFIDVARGRGWSLRVPSVTE